MIFFLGYLICYYVRSRKIKIAENLPEEMNAVRWYGFSKASFYLLDNDNVFRTKKCNKEDKDYLRLKYSELPKYKHFFWKLPAYLVLLTITTATICGVIKSGTNLNGKLAWYLFELRHTPIVAKQQEEDGGKREDSTIMVQETVEDATEEIDVAQEDTTEEIDVVQEDTSDVETGAAEETRPEQYPDEELYGNIHLSEKYYEDENGNTEYHYEVYQYVFSDSKYRKVNETLQGIYDKMELEFQEYYELEGGYHYIETVPEGLIDYEEKTWFLVNLEYAGEDYVSLLFNKVAYWPGAPHPMSYFTPVTIDVHTGEIADLEDILGCTWDELSQQLYGDGRLNSEDYGFYLYGEEIHFIYRTSYFVDEIVIPREGTDD